MPTASEILAVSRNGFAEGLFMGVRAEAPIVANFEALPMIGTQYLSIAVVGLAAAKPFILR